MRRVTKSVSAVAPEARIGRILAGSQFIDAYQVVVAGHDLEALDAARVMLADSPVWVDALMALRNAVVRPLGLKTGRDIDEHRDRIGIFPIRSASPGRVVLGFEDKHLDFRVVVDVSPFGEDRRVTATTLVRLHNLLGRAYLTSILPFHKLIVRAALGRVVDQRRSPSGQLSPRTATGAGLSAPPTKR